MKLWGILLLLLSSAGTGMLAASRLTADRQALELLCAWTEDAAASIRYTQTELPELLAMLANHPNYRRFRFAEEILGQLSPLTPPEMLWKAAVLSDTAVPDAAKEILIRLGTSLGTTDCEGQLASLALCRTQLLHAAEEAAENARVKGRMYRALGFLGGAMAAVVLL